MANVTFRNALQSDAYLHMRIGAVNVNPDDRGTNNDTLRPGEQVDVPVGDGDVWYCFGNQMVSNAENPKLCKADGGATVVLDGAKPCYVDN